MRKGSERTELLEAGKTFGVSEVILAVLLWGYLSFMPQLI